MVRFMLALLMLAVSAQFVGAHDMASCKADPQASACLEKMKTLEGNWKGTSMQMHGKTMIPTVSYALTAGGTAVEEKLMKGTPGEMTTMYYVEGGKVCMTHYCSSGNHPGMTVKSQTDNSITFEMVGVNGIGSADEKHMHQLTITWKDKNHISQDWVSYDKGKQADKAHFDFERVAEN